MAEPQSYDELMAAARHGVDDAIAAFARLGRNGGSILTGWVITLQGVDMDGDHTVGYLTADGQSYVTTVGLLATAHDHWRSKR